MTTTRLLVVDGDAVAARAVRAHFEAKGIRVTVAPTIEAAVAAHRAAPADVAVLAARPGAASALTTFRELQRQHRPPECIILARDGTVAAAVEAMRAGAFDYVAGSYTLDDLAARVTLAAAIHAAAAAGAVSPPPPLDEVERRHIAAVLAEVGWHQGRAARILRISPKTLYRKIRAYGFRRPRRGRGGAAT